MTKLYFQRMCFGNRPSAACVHPLRRRLLILFVPLALFAAVGTSLSPSLLPISSWLNVGAIRLNASSVLSAPLLQSASSAGHDSIVGTWYVCITGAPFAPHLFKFDSDKTMESDNPESGDKNTSDSVGMGPWKTVDENTFTGEFQEINADRVTHVFVSTLVVDYTIVVTGDTFVTLPQHPAEATYYNPDTTKQAGPFPATFKGTRIRVSNHLTAPPKC